ATRLAVMAVHWREDVTSSGMVETDAEDRILRYMEKPPADAVTSHWVNAGFYYLHPKVLDYIPAGEFCDFSYHVFPAMLQAGEVLYAAKMDQPIIGIDTLEAYNQADEYARTLRARVQ
ncbi:MAG: NDP-sugar synthase, partial [Kiritimatiellota bacterium]|nr:NDP-sugar synthase [Kiritimatiellota bacterium]